MLIRLNERQLQNFLAKANPNLQDENACWNWTGCCDRDGYGVVSIRDRNWRAPRVSYSHFIGEIPEGKIVMHSCDNPRCVNPKHLSLGTSGMNTRDADSKGRIPRGENHPKSKLTNEDVEFIKAYGNMGKFTYKQIAKAFNVSEDFIGQILRKEHRVIC